MITLNNGVQMPQEGLGVLNAGDDNQVKQAVLDGLSAGYRLFDTAPAYQNETAIGMALAESRVKRQDLFLTTKVWAGYEATKASVNNSLQSLQTDYLDLVLLHQPFGDYYGAYRALEEFYDEGRIRAIGVANFLPDRFADLAEFSRVTPVVDQIETHVFNQQWSLRKTLDNYHAQLESWGPFAEGKNDFFKNETLRKIGETHGKTGPQVALRYLTQNGIIIIPKSVHPKRMAENMDIWDFTLSAEELAIIRQLDTQRPLFYDQHDPSTVETMAQFLKGSLSGD